MPEASQETSLNGDIAWDLIWSTVTEELWEYSYHMGYQIMGKPNVYHDYGLLISHDN